MRPGSRTPAAGRSCTGRLVKVSAPLHCTQRGGFPAISACNNSSWCQIRNGGGKGEGGVGGWGGHCKYGGAEGCNASLGGTQGAQYSRRGGMGGVASSRHVWALRSQTAATKALPSAKNLVLIFCADLILPGTNLKELYFPLQTSSTAVLRLSSGKVGGRFFTTTFLRSLVLDTM